MATFNGDSDDNVLPSTDDPDLIQGFGGADTLAGGKGNDTLAGFTTLGGDIDGDFLSGGEDDDTLYVSGDDTARGDDGNDLFNIFGNAGAPARLDGGGGFDALFLNSRDIAGAELFGIELLIASDFSGGRLTADQLGSFARVAGLPGRSTVDLQLSGGGTAFIVPDVALAILQIQGSLQGETLTMGPGATTRLLYRGQINADTSFITGGAGDDHLEGGYGVDVLSGASGNDTLAGYFVGQGARDADRLFGGDGADELHLDRDDGGDGGAGDDVFVLQGSFAPAFLGGGDGVDTVRLTRLNSLSFGLGSPAPLPRNMERLEADGNPGADLTARQLGRFGTVAPLTGQTTAHLFLSGGGTAAINPEAGLAMLTIVGSNEAESLTVAAASTTRLVYRGAGGGTAVDAVSTVLAGSGDDLLEGGEAADLLDGGAGDDTLAGDTVHTVGNDADRLFGRSGRDTLFVGRGDRAEGGAGDDTFSALGGFSAAFLNGGDGVDVVRLDPGESIALANVDEMERLEVAVLSGGGRLTASQLNDFEAIAPFAGATVAAVTLAAGGTARHIATDPLLLNLVVNGSNGDETIGLAVGSAARLHFNGANGDDVAFGGARVDVLRGGFGDDSLAGGAGDDVIDGGSGRDLVSYFGAPAGVQVDLADPDGAQDTGEGIDQLISIEDVRGSEHADRIAGSAAANKLVGGGDDDTLAGGGGADFLSGGEQNDGLRGEAGDDDLAGGAGSDGLDGGAGLDVLLGGEGADIFIFMVATDSAVGTRRDVIADFVRGEDLIDLTNVDANSTVAGDQEFHFINSAAFGEVAGQLRFAAGRLSGDVNGDGSADFEIAVPGVGSLGGADLQL